VGVAIAPDVEEHQRVTKETDGRGKSWLVIGAALLIGGAVGALLIWLDTEPTYPSKPENVILYLKQVPRRH
jgi:hypothetical protein